MGRRPIPRGEPFEKGSPPPKLFVRSVFVNVLLKLSLVLFQKFITIFSMIFNEKLVDISTSV